MTILVTGASGNVGVELVRMLLADGHSVRALSRQPAAHGLPAGVESVTGDLADRGTLSAAFKNVDAIFLLAGYPDTPGILTDLRAAGVSRVVLLSSGAVVGGDLDNYVVRFNVVSEAAVRDSSLAWTVLRPSGFMSNTRQWLDQLRTGDVVLEPFADVPIAVIDPLDVAAAAAVSLTTKGHDGRSYRLTGPESLRPADRADILGAALGRHITVVAETDADARQRMLGEMPTPVVESFFQFFRDGGYDDSRVDPTTSTLLGRPAGTFAQWATRHAEDFQ